VVDRKGRGPRDGDEYEGKAHDELPGAVRVHQAYLDHRLAGGEPATPEAYRRAVEQFQKLPGAVRSVPSPAAPERPGTDAAHASDDDEEGEPQ
jgi:hypothetical protein